MNGKPSLIRAFLFIRKNRFRKKREFYMMAIRLMIDPVIAIYLVLIGGYVIASLFIMGGIIETYHHYFILAQEQAILRYWIVVAIFPLRYLLRSFQQPGVIFSSSDYQLGILPFLKERIWVLSVIEKWIKQLLLYIIVGTIITLATPISGLVVSAYILLFFVMEVIMTIPQWKLFQAGLVTKLCWICSLIIVNIIALLTSYFIVSLLVVLVIIGINLKLVGSTFHKVHWGKVMEASDFKIWNMPIIGKASETKFKRQRKYSTFRNSAGQKKAFTYTAKTIHHRLWRIYLTKNMDLVLKAVGILFLLLMVVLVIANVAFPAAIAIAIYVFSSVVGILFSDRFQSDILHVLPWDLQTYKRSLLKWIGYGSLPLLIPVIIYLILHGSIWAPIQAAFYISTFLFVCQMKLDKTIALLSKQSGFSSNMGLGYLFLILIALSGLYPIVSLSFIVVIGLLVDDVRKSK